MNGFRMHKNATIIIWYVVCCEINEEFLGPLFYVVFVRKRPLVFRVWISTWYPLPTPALY